MSKALKLTLGSGFTLFAILVAGFFILQHLVTKSFPITEGSVTLPGFHANVDIYRDDFGVPHIRAQNEHDLMFAAGYVHAQDRLWQMDMMRRVGEGRLSEVLGRETVEFDVLHRTLGLNEVAKQIERQLHPESKRLLEDYAQGVNVFIQSHKGKFPIEFDMLNYEPEPWTVQHSLLGARLMAWQLNFSWWVDLTYAEIASRVSPEKFQEIIPSYIDSIPSIASMSLIEKPLQGIHNVLSVVRSYRDFASLGPFSAGSNAWVVDASKSLSGKPLLANDPHLIISLPAQWYVLHLSAPGWNVSGVSIPGVPFIVIGHNDSIAWGFTNAMLDDADFYTEQEDSVRTNHYWFKNKLQPMKLREEAIYIGSSDSITITVRSTHHGPIINDAHPSRKHAYNDTLTHLVPIAMRWTGFDVSDEFYGFYLINRASNHLEFEKGLRELTVPGQCVVYADVHGNIGFWTAGHVPLRGKRNPFLPVSGQAGDVEWHGFVPFERLPKLWNPVRGNIVSANQNIADANYPSYLSHLWEPPYRSQRIVDLLLTAEKFNDEDFKLFQQDVTSYHGRELTPYIIRAFERDTVLSPSVKAMLEYFRNWDFRCTQSDIATTIFNMFFVRLLHNIFEDEMGNDVFDDFVYFSAIPYRVASQLITLESSLWFDDIRTERIETREDMIRKSIVEAIDTLTSLLGSEMKAWQWGELHKALFAHPFGKKQPLARVFNIGPLPCGGSASTVNKADYKISLPFYLFSCPSMRQVIDMANPKAAFTVLPSGQSGQPFHEHYDNQTSLWLNGGYYRVTMDWDEITKSKWEKLVLKSRRG
ncbi:MAG: penicillin acylase family protein [Ignavibacteriae bacterium]|nr:penicillin acylase family protein [Ignavibacteriota bacterium]